MRIAYIGPASGTSLHRARALERLGHVVIHCDPWQWLGHSKWMSRWLHHAGGVGFNLRLDRPLMNAVSAAGADMVFVNQGEVLGPSALGRLRSLAIPIVNYTNDNPFVTRDRRRFTQYLRALPFYDLVAYPVVENLAQATAAGARQVMRFWFTADEVAHRHRVVHASNPEFSSAVCFVGTWMPERGPFMAELIRRGVPLSIWGDRWQRAFEWPTIAPHWRGPGVYDDDGYARIVQSAEVCLGLLSKGNRNLHTSRSVEIPALGGLLCAERTSEHQALYDEGVEAVFWSDAKECAAVCNRLLNDKSLRDSVAARGHARALRNNLFNEPMLSSVIERAMSL